jgi:hypothetical protein
MQVQSVNSQYNMSFGTYLSRKSASIIKGITNELRTNVSSFGNKTLTVRYEKKGYDCGQDLVTMTAYKGLRVKGAGIDR